MRHLTLFFLLVSSLHSAVTFAVDEATIKSTEESLRKNRDLLIRTQNEISRATVEIEKIMDSPEIIELLQRADRGADNRQFFGSENPDSNTYCATAELEQKLLETGFSEFEMDNRDQIEKILLSCFGKRIEDLSIRQNRAFKSFLVAATINLASNLASAAIAMKNTDYARKVGFAIATTYGIASAIGGLIGAAVYYDIKDLKSELEEQLNKILELSGKIAELGKLADKLNNQIRISEAALEYWQSH